MEFDDTVVSLYMKEIEDKDLSNVFQDFKLSNCKIYWLKSLKKV